VKGDMIKFENVDIVSPEGKLLVKNVSFEVPPGRNVMVTGPNGSGKSSLFRIIGGLWPLHNGLLCLNSPSSHIFGRCVDKAKK
jgi:ATP-binding cassette subfamily D (ALD) protein 3